MQCVDVFVFMLNLLLSLLSFSVFAVSFHCSNEKTIKCLCAIYVFVVRIENFKANKKKKILHFEYDCSFATAIFPNIISNIINHKSPKKIEPTRPVNFVRKILLQFCLLSLVFFFLVCALSSSSGDGRPVCPKNCAYFFYGSDSMAFHISKIIAI